MKKNIVYRNIYKKDYEIIEDMIVKTFNLHKYITNKKYLENIKKHYIYGCLAEATYINVAEDNGKIAGIIMGNSKNDYDILKHINFIIKSLKYSLRIKFSSKNDKKELIGYQNLQNIYKKMLEKHKNEFDGVLTLFIVDKEYRGLGIGYKLLKDLLLYLKNQKTKKIYLYTDTTCNYKFYEKQGFSCIEKDKLNILKENKNFIMDIFLYEYFLV